MSFPNPGLPITLNFADPATGRELTADVAYEPTEYVDAKTGDTRPDGPDRIVDIEELADADTGEPVAITDAIRAAIDEAFRAEM